MHALNRFFEIFWRQWLIKFYDIFFFYGEFWMFVFVHEDGIISQKK